MRRRPGGKAVFMPPYRGCHQAVVDATPQICFREMTDYARLPEWQGALKDATVLERDVDALVVRYEVDAKVKTVAYTLRHRMDAPHVIESEYIDGPFRDFSGCWRFEPSGDGRTEVTLDLTIDPGRWMPGPVVRAIRDAVVKRAVEDLRRHVESIPAHSRGVGAAAAG